MDEKPKLGSLAKIREQFSGKMIGADRPIDIKTCPLCGYRLTIDKSGIIDVECCENCFDFWETKDKDACCRTPSFHRVKLITSSGGIQVREQCSSCGETRTNSIGGLSKEEREKLPVLNDDLRQSRNNARIDCMRKASRDFHAKKASRSRQNWLKEYSSYLDSPEWRNKRELVLKRDNYRCQACLDAPATQVHHRSYEFVDMAGSEPGFDLVAICGPCHEKIEQMKKDRRNIQ